MKCAKDSIPYTARPASNRGQGCIHLQKSPVIRAASLEDAAAITAVINAAFHRAEAFFIEGDRIDHGKVCDLMRAGKFLVAEDDGALIGCVYLELRGERSYIGLLSVDPRHQNIGLGSRLMDAAEKYCSAAGCRFVDLQTVNLRKELAPFYFRRGYKETGTAPFPAEVATKLPCHFVKRTKELT